MDRWGASSRRSEPPSAKWVTVSTHPRFGYASGGPRRRRFATTSKVCRREPEPEPEPMLLSHYRHSQPLQLGLHPLLLQLRQWVVVSLKISIHYSCDVQRFSTRLHPDGTVCCDLPKRRLTWPTSFPAVQLI